MNDGFLRVACATPDIKVCDVDYNTNNILSMIKNAEEEGIKLVTFPELCITGYTCGDLFLQRTLQKAASDALIEIAKKTACMDIIIVVGLPFAHGNALYNVAAVLKSGKILGIVPKMYMPNYSEFYELRHFSSMQKTQRIQFNNEEILMGSHLLFSDSANSAFCFGIEICEDLWVPLSPSTSHAISGARLIINPSASDEMVAKSDYRRDLVRMQSAKLVCAYLYVNAGNGESTTDMVYSGQNIICENGVLLAESKLFDNSMIIADIDLDLIAHERRRMNSFPNESNEKYETIYFRSHIASLHLKRAVNPYPFVPSNPKQLTERCDTIFAIQAAGLKKRLAHTKGRCAVIGLSGGLDSTLALLVTVRAFDELGWPHKDIIAVTMPCFGTTDRTYQNAKSLAAHLGTTLLDIPIRDAVLQHFKDIELEEDDRGAAYENSQARERTQVLMDISNKNGGFVVGTGDLSELALGWATYNGDHMSMYAVNTSIPKTLVRHLVRFVAGAETGELKDVLIDILNTPVSPELLPPENGEISQKTEELVGPYELHDFVLYYVVRFGFAPSKIYRLANIAFKGIYDSTTIKKWMLIFYKRFFSQQFKRSCLPDGPKVGSVTLSPRGDWRMPSDAVSTIWIRELENL
jgi:NAD+ synthase (glutamine-hydrolysing)